MRQGERQVAPDVTSIRRDHVARYEWAARVLPRGLRVVDVACGVGYGSKLLAEAWHQVHAVDCDAEALGYASEHYAHAQVKHWQCDVSDGLDFDEEIDAAICFETIEHVKDPRPLLLDLRKRTKRLLASVPNEEAFPFAGHLYHFRHYTVTEFIDLLAECGWSVSELIGQEGPDSDVDPGVRPSLCRTIVADCEPIEGFDFASPLSKKQRFVRPAPEIETVPKSVAILGLGPSIDAYTFLARNLGARGKAADEVWAINALGDVLQCDRIFHMDDVRVQEIRAAAKPQSNIAAMLHWLKSSRVPVYTSCANSEYPATVDYPLEWVVNKLGYAYFNNTAAYALAYAIALGVQRVSVFGCDYTYANSHDAEKGRGCLEFWLGFACARGIQVRLPQRTSLMDACEPETRRTYGYDCVDVHRTKRDDGTMSYEFVEKTRFPTAEEIEDAYDHSKHSNPLLSG